MLKILMLISLFLLVSSSVSFANNTGACGGAEQPACCGGVGEPACPENIYTPPNSYSGGLDFDAFGERYDEFLATVLSSDLFSLPRRVFNLDSAIVTSTSAFDVPMGRFGTYSFDLGSFSSLILTMKVTLLLFFSIVSLRIAVLGRW